MLLNQLSNRGKSRRLSRNIVIVPRSEELAKETISRRYSMIASFITMISVLDPLLCRWKLYSKTLNDEQLVSRTRTR